MKLTVRIAGFEENDPYCQLMLDKKAELHDFCKGYEAMLKELLPKYAIDGVLPAVLIVPDKKTVDGLKDFFKFITAEWFEKQPQLASLGKSLWDSIENGDDALGKSIRQVKKGDIKGLAKTIGSATLEGIKQTGKDVRTHREQVTSMGDTELHTLCNNNSLPWAKRAAAYRELKNRNKTI